MKKFLVFVFALAMVVAFAVPSYAEFTYTFKGDARMETYSVTQSKEFVGANEDQTDTRWSKDNILSRFSITAKSENIKGYIEIRPNVGSYVRHWFGEWDFGAGKLLVGKTWTPATFFTNGQNFNGNGIAAYGNLNADAARVDQIRLTFGGLVIGFLDPTMGFHRNYLGVPNAFDTETTIPNIEATYTLKLDPVKLEFAGGYGTYTINAPGSDYDVDSYFLGAAASFNLGPVYVNVEGHIAQNGAQYGLNYGDTDAGANRIFGDAQYFNGEIRDNDSYGYLAAVGFKINDMMTVEAGYSYLECELDVPGYQADDASWMYIMLPITVAPGVTIAPEVGKIDEGDGPTGQKQGDRTYFGALWKIAF